MWQYNLYADQSARYEDRYVPDDFLAGFPSYRRKYPWLSSDSSSTFGSRKSRLGSAVYLHLVVCFVPVLLHFLLIVGFAAAFVWLHEGHVSGDALLLCDVAVWCGGILVLRAFGDPSLRGVGRRFGHVFDSLAVLLGVLLVLAAPLYSLVYSFSSDTIYKLAVAGGLLWLGSTPYAPYYDAQRGRAAFAVVWGGSSGSRALCAAVTLAVLLGSRLRSNDDMFSLLFTAFTLLVAGPFWCIRVCSMGRDEQVTHPVVHCSLPFPGRGVVLLTAMIYCGCMLAVGAVSFSAVTWVSALCAVLVFVGPAVWGYASLRCAVQWRGRWHYDEAQEMQSWGNM